MRLTISSLAPGNNQRVLALEVPGDMSIESLKALIADELSVTSDFTLHLYHNGQLLADPARTPDSHAMKDDDMIVVHLQPKRLPQAQQPQPSSSRPQQQQQQQQQRRSGGSNIEYDFEMIRLQVLGDPRLQNELRTSNPALFETINDPEAFRVAFERMEREKAEAEREKAREIQMLNEDPFNIEAQQKIEELIRQEQVMENLQSALEHNPEAFGRVTMLYIPVEVNGTAVKAFVDSGAQATIMSPSCAQRCGIMRLVDSRYSGIARGVGTAKILGRVHSAQIRIGNLFLACSFTVMEGKDVDLLLGLDMLKRHQATIDLGKGVLSIQGEEVPFLGESEIPKWGEEEEPSVEGPGGARVGGRSGAIVEPPVHGIPQAQPQQQQQQQQQPQQQPQQQEQKSSHSDEKISQLVSLGFSRHEAISALNATNGDVNMAASLLFN